MDKAENSEIHERRKCRNKMFLVFKIPLLSVCLYVFIYQTTDFLNLYWTYPEIITRKIETERNVVFPAVSFCESSSAFRNAFCKKYPGRCQEPGPRICNIYPEFCRNGGRKFVDNQLYRDEEELRTLGRNLSEFVTYKYNYRVTEESAEETKKIDESNEDDDDNDDGDDDDDDDDYDDYGDDDDEDEYEEDEYKKYEDEDPENATYVVEDEHTSEIFEDYNELETKHYEEYDEIGSEISPEKRQENVKNVKIEKNVTTWPDMKTPFFISESTSREILECYTINSLVDSYKYPFQIRLNTTEYLNSGGGLGILHLTFRINLDDVSMPWINRGVYFQIHSPFVAVNPSEEGVLLKPGTSNKFQLYLEEEHLLPFPYSTECIDYTTEWKRNNRTGFRSQQMCLSECQIKSLSEHNRCVPLWIQNPHPHSRCVKHSGDEFKIADGLHPFNDSFDYNNSQFEECASKCKASCVNHKYRYTVHEGPLLNYAEENTHIRYINVTVSLRKPEVLTIRRLPQYEDVELFSYICGHIACWMGILLIATSDIIESICVFIKKIFTSSK